MMMMGQNSNVIELFSMLKKDDQTKQMVYYQVCSDLERGVLADRL